MEHKLLCSVSILLRKSELENLLAGKKESRFEFIIVAGSLKGRRLTAPDLGVTRPPLTRLRRAIFDFLNPYLDDATYLDLFSGTGSYLFEAVSRGAKLAIGVELEPLLCESINSQAETVGIEARMFCQVADVFEAIPNFEKQGRRFDIIMIAPPQYIGLTDRTLAHLREHALLSESGMIICQQDTSEIEKTNFLDYELLQRRKYGNTTFSILVSPKTVIP